MVGRRTTRKGFFVELAAWAGAVLLLCKYLDVHRAPWARTATFPQRGLAEHAPWARAATFLQCGLAEHAADSNAVIGTLSFKTVFKLART